MSIFRANYLEGVLHLFFWLIYFFYPVLKHGDYSEYRINWQTTLIDSGFLLFCTYTSYAIFHYLKGRYWRLIFLLPFLMLLAYVNCIISFNLSECGCSLRVCFFNKMVNYIFFNTLFFSIFSIKEVYKKQQLLEQSELKRASFELDSLKAQINPHFLFNTLNLLYSRAIAADEVLARQILQLSDNLHYVLHEGTKDQVEIEKEIDFLKDFIDLQKARMGEKIDVEFSYVVDQPTQLLSPMLMLPFVENAFKYTSMLKGKALDLKIALTLKNNQLKFRCTNPFNPNYPKGQDKIWKSSGIGINNVKERLALIYPEKYNLIIANDNDIFDVQMNIEL